MTLSPNMPPRHNRRLRDHDKLARGKVNFKAVVEGVCKVEDLTTTALDDAVYYAFDSVTAGTGTNRIKKEIRAEAKKRGLLIK